MQNISCSFSTLRASRMLSALASSKILCFSLFVAVVAAASPMLLKLRDFTNSMRVGEMLGLLAMKVQLESPWLMAAGTLIIGYIFLRLWRLFFVPLRMERKLHEIGYTPDGKRSLKDIANDIRKRRRCGDVPPVYPNGWYRVLDSDELVVEEVKYISMLGEQLAVFRGTDGVAHVVNAYCPHLGANLGIGGKVRGNCLQCPFHGWTFRGEDGKCVEIPYTENVPDVAKIKVWPCLETNCTLYLWYHAEGIDPTWTPDEIEEIKNGSWTYRGYTQHVVDAHIEEIPENGADLSHLEYLHSTPIVAGSDIRDNYSNWCHVGKHLFKAAWEPLENEEKHVGLLHLKHSLYLFGYKIPFGDFHLTARQTGPSLVFMKFKTMFGDGIFLHSLVPKEPLLLTVRHSVYAAKTIPTILAKLYLIAEAIQFERDVMVWNHKTYISKPLLVKEDHSIKKHRRWYSQFFSENSPRLSMRKESLDW